MAAHRILIVAAVLALAGCADDDKDVAALRSENSKLKSEVVTLQAKLDEQAGARAAEIAYMERQASIADACDAIVSTCPTSMTATGHKAQANGYSGGGRVFWAVLVAKLAALGVGLGLMFGVSGWLWFRLAMPKKAEVEAAAAVIEQGNRKVAAASRALAVEAGAKERTEAEQAELKQIREEKEAEKKELLQVRAEIAAAKAAQDALDSF